MLKCILQYQYFWAWKFKLDLLESFDQDLKPIEAINCKAKKPERNDKTWVDGQEFSWKRFPKWPRKASFSPFLHYYNTEDTLYLRRWTMLYCIHYILEILNPQGGQRKTTKKMNKVEFASSKNSSKRSLNWLFSWSTDTLEPEFYILQEKPKLPLPTQHKRKSEGLF